LIEFTGPGRGVPASELTQIDRIYQLQTRASSEDLKLEILKIVHNLIKII